MKPNSKNKTSFPDVLTNLLHTLNGSLKFIYEKNNKNRFILKNCIEKYIQIRYKNMLEEEEEEFFLKCEQHLARLVHIKPNLYVYLR